MAGTAQAWKPHVLHPARNAHAALALVQLPWLQGPRGPYLIKCTLQALKFSSIVSNVLRWRPRLVEAERRDPKLPSLGKKPLGSAQKTHVRRNCLGRTASSLQPKRDRFPAFCRRNKAEARPEILDPVRRKAYATYIC